MYRAAEAGVFRPDERLELIDGRLIVRERRSPACCVATCLIADWARWAAGSDRHVRTGFPLALGPRDEPEPDIAIVRGRIGDYLHEHPQSYQAALVVELSEHKGDKPWRYARAGVGEVWLVDVEERRLEVCRDPTPEGYTTVVTLAEHECAAPLFRPEAWVVVSELLPHRKP